MTMLLSGMGTLLGVGFGLSLSFPIFFELSNRKTEEYIRLAHYKVKTTSKDSDTFKREIKKKILSNLASIEVSKFENRRRQLIVSIISILNALVIFIIVAISSYSQNIAINIELYVIIVAFCVLPMIISMYFYWKWYSSVRKLRKLVFIKNGADITNL